MLIIGIDPGITGAICFFEDKKIIGLIEMPNMAVGKKNLSTGQAKNIFPQKEKQVYVD